MADKLPIVVIFRKSERSKKRYMSVVYDRTVDEVITKKRNPVIDNSYVIDDVGIGNAFIEIYMNQYSINKYNKIKK